MRRSQPESISDDLRVYYAWAVFGPEEEAAVSRFLKSRKLLSGGEYTRQFESQVALLFGKKFGLMVNSGSSANLIATELLRLEKGSEVITPVLTFSTTVAPLLQKDLKPVFVDVHPGTYQIQTDGIEDVISGRTGAMVVPSLLGNIPDMRSLREIADRAEVCYVEDSCDTIGARFAGRPTGTYSDISTSSFYGSHIITACGGGGLVAFNSDEWWRRARVLRGWGRSSSVDEGEDIQLRFSRGLDGLEYDSKFVFEEVGYNFWPLEVAAVFGLEQLKRLGDFADRRRRNFERLTRLFAPFKDLFTLPIQLDEVETAWLAYPLTIREGAPFSRRDIVTYLEENNVQTRPIFTGNVLRQPAFAAMGRGSPAHSFPNADLIMRNGFLIGCHQGLEESHLRKVETLIQNFVASHNHA